MGLVFEKLVQNWTKTLGWEIGAENEANMGQMSALSGQ